MRQVIIALLVATAGSYAQQPGTIITIAGNGMQSYAGDSGPAVQASFSEPMGVAVDTAGNVYIVDDMDARVRKVSPAGVVTTVAGNGRLGLVGDGDGGPATSAALYFPIGVAVDPTGNLYIAEGGDIRKVNTTGTISTIAGDSTHVITVQSLAVDRAGNVYFTEPGDHRVRKISPTGTITPFAGNGTKGYTGDNGPATAASLDNPISIAVDAQGNIYIGDNGSHRIRKVTPSGTISTIAGNGTTGFSGDNGPAIAASFSAPEGLAIDAIGNLYLTDTYNNRLRTVGADGTITTVVGNGSAAFTGDNGPASAGTLAKPWGVATDTAGNIYIADVTNRRIRKVIAGTAPPPPSSAPVSTLLSVGLNGPVAVAVDVQGNIYIADTNNNAIKKWTATNQQVTTLVATVTAPGGVAVDGLGNVYFHGLKPNAVNQVRNLSKWTAANQQVTTLAADISASGGIAVDGPGNIYIAGLGVSAIMKWTPTALQLTPLVLGLTEPAGVAVDGQGNLYVADIAIKKWSAINQELTTLVSAGLSYPAGVAIDNQGNVYIADTQNNAIKKWDSSSQQVTTLLSSGLNNPRGIAVDAQGNVYIADTGNNAIKVIAATAPACNLTCAASAPTGGTTNTPASFTGTATATNCSANTTYDWNFGDGTGHASQQNPTHAYDTAGNYQWGMTATAGTASCVKSGIISITAQSSLAPTFSAGGVTNAATGQPGLVPGSLATLYGIGLTKGVSGVVQASGSPWPRTLAGTSLSVNGVAAPIYAVANVNGQEQINFQVPWEVADKATALLVVNNNGSLNSGVSVPVLAAQPGVFMLNATQGAVLRMDGSVVGPSNPARPGEVLVLYATGLGAVDFQPGTGVPAPSAEPLARAVQGWGGVSIGLPATVLYAGLAGGYVGLYQINVLVPETAPSGTLSLVLTVQGRVSPVLSLPVAGLLQQGDFSYLESFAVGGHALWQVAVHDGPGGITQAHNVLFPGVSSYLGSCGSLTVASEVVLVVPSRTCATAYSAYQDGGDHQWYSGAGGQVQTSLALHFGYYEVVMKSSSASGVVNGFFIYAGMPDDKDRNEIDIEILSKENDVAHSAGFANFTVFLPGQRKVTFRAPLVDATGRSFAPWLDFHRYGFDWRPDGLTWYVDGQQVPIPSCTTKVGDTEVSNPGCFAGRQNVPQFPGFLMMNNWTNGGTWSGALPTADALMNVRTVSVAPLFTQR